LSDVNEELRSRVELYVSAVEDALRQIEKQKDCLNKKEKELVHLATLYLEDTRYYLGKNDVATALATISYAEGLLDALARLGRVRIEWKREKRKKVLAAGTFDILHPGHIAILSEASKHGNLYVIVSRDDNARKSKGRDPIFPEESRLLIVNSLKPVKKAVLGDKSDILKPIVEIKPDIIFLGPDQMVDENWLLKELEKRGLKNVKVIRMKERIATYKPNSSSQVILDIIRKFCYEDKNETLGKPPAPDR